MKVTEHLELAEKPLFSYEIIPPARGQCASEIYAIVEKLHPFNPPFIDVTNHSPVAYYEDIGNGNLRRRFRKKRPGTAGICTVIQNRYGIDAVPHLLCRGFTREETEDAVIELSYLDTINVMAIRGDEEHYLRPSGTEFSVHTHADGLVKQLDALRRGQYLEDLDNSEPIDLCIGVCGYPEKHIQAPNQAVCLRYLKQKVDAGADYIVTQMFFDNDKFFSFLDACREIGITVPIIPGIKILNSARQLSTLPGTFHLTLPTELVDDVMANPKQADKIGIKHGQKQCQELLERGINCLHFYVLNDVASVIEVVRHL